MLVRLWWRLTANSHPISILHYVSFRVRWLRGEEQVGTAHMDKWKWSKIRGRTATTGPRHKGPLRVRDGARTIRPVTFCPATLCPQHLSNGHFVQWHVFPWPNCPGSRYFVDELDFHSLLKNLSSRWKIKQRSQFFSFVLTSQLYPPHIWYKNGN